jgi:hypothetical protein
LITNLGTDVIYSCRYFFIHILFDIAETATKEWGVIARLGGMYDSIEDDSYGRMRIETWVLKEQMASEICSTWMSNGSVAAG